MRGGRGCQRVRSPRCVDSDHYVDAFHNRALSPRGVEELCSAFGFEFDPAFVRREPVHRVFERMLRNLQGIYQEEEQAAADSQHPRSELGGRRPCYHCYETAALAVRRL